MESIQMKTRPLPSSLAPVVEELELRRPAVVTRRLLGEIASRTEVRLDVGTLAERLVRLGWLMPLRKRDSWEFAPAARAGRYRSGDPWIELRALLEHEPKAPVAVAFESAVWELGHSSHQPTEPVLAHRRDWRPPRSLDARAVTFDWRLPTRSQRGLPIWTEATVVVAAAQRPGAQGNWANADDWLPNTFRGAVREDVITEARGRGVSTLARLGYLAEWAGREDIADEVEALLPARLPVTFLGPRDRRDRWSRRWRVYDALLPAR
jgi:AbiEi antitoxin C-terminal domain